MSCLPIREAGRGLGVVVIGCAPPRDLTRDEIDVVSAAIRQAAARLLVINDSGGGLRNDRSPPRNP